MRGVWRADAGRSNPPVRVVVIPDAAHITRWDNPYGDVQAVRIVQR